MAGSAVVVPALRWLFPCCCSVKTSPAQFDMPKVDARPAHLGLPGVHTDCRRSPACNLRQSLRVRCRQSCHLRQRVIVSQAVSNVSYRADIHRRARIACVFAKIWGTITSDPQIPNHHRPFQRRPPLLPRTPACLHVLVNSVTHPQRPPHAISSPSLSNPRKGCTIMNDRSPPSVGPVIKPLREVGGYLSA